MDLYGTFIKNYNASFASTYALTKKKPAFAAAIQVQRTIAILMFSRDLNRCRKKQRSCTWKPC